MGWSVLQLKPSGIRYTQDSIKNTFSKPDAHEGKLIGETLDELCEGKCVVEDIDTIDVFQKDGRWWSADNRRLWVFRAYERLGGCETIPAKQISENRVDSRKFTTENGGSEIRVREYRGDPGGQWHRKPNGFLSRKIKPSQPATSSVGRHARHQASHQSYISGDSNYNTRNSNYGHTTEHFRSSGLAVERSQPYSPPTMTPVMTPRSLISYGEPMHSPPANPIYQNHYTYNNNNKTRVTTSPASSTPPTHTPRTRPPTADHTIVLGLPEDSRSTKKSCCVIS